MMKLVLTCEHGGNKIPDEYKKFFRNSKEALNSHRGYDPGALDLFFKLENISDFSQYSEISRLLVELNRSLHHHHIFSKFTKDIPAKRKKGILEEFYFPYRKNVTEKIHELISKSNHVLHVSVHSFTDELNGELRNNDIGLLYDPAVKSEKTICKEWKILMKKQNQSLRIRFNYPYLGTADGFTTSLRKVFKNQYSGIELEVNQKYVQGNSLKPEIKKVIKETLLQIKQRSLFPLER